MQEPRRQQKSQSLTAEEGKGPFPPLLMRVSADRGCCVSESGGVWSRMLSSLWFEMQTQVSWLADRCLEARCPGPVVEQGCISQPCSEYSLCCELSWTQTRIHQDWQSDGWRWVGQVDTRAITSIPVLEGVEKFAVYFMNFLRVSAVCSCGELWDLSPCACSTIMFPGCQFS